MHEQSKNQAPKCEDMLIWSCFKALPDTWDPEKDQEAKAEKDLLCRVLNPLLSICRGVSSSSWLLFKQPYLGSQDHQTLSLYQYQVSVCGHISRWMPWNGQSCISSRNGDWPTLDCSRRPIVCDCWSEILSKSSEWCTDEQKIAVD